MAMVGVDDGSVHVDSPQVAMTGVEGRQLLHRSDVADELSE